MKLPKKVYYITSTNETQIIYLEQIGNKPIVEKIKYISGKIFTDKFRPTGHNVLQILNEKRRSS